MYIDTKAEILWKMRSSREALAEIIKCSLFKPNDSYYKDQEDKMKRII